MSEHTEANDSSTGVSTPNNKRCLPGPCHQLLSKKKRFITPFKSNSDLNVGTKADTASPVISKSSPISCRSSLNKSKFKPPANIASPTATVVAKAGEEPKLVKAKEELRRLKIVEYHRKNNDLETLTKLTDVWKAAGHTALHELHATISIEPKPTPTELLTHLHIPPDHIHCDCDDI